MCLYVTGRKRKKERDLIKRIVLEGQEILRKGEVSSREIAHTRIIKRIVLGGIRDTRKGRGT